MNMVYGPWTEEKMNSEPVKQGASFPSFPSAGQITLVPVCLSRLLNMRPPSLLFQLLLLSLPENGHAGGAATYPIVAPPILPAMVQCA